MIILLILIRYYWLFEVNVEEEQISHPRPTHHREREKKILIKKDIRSRPNRRNNSVINKIIFINIIIINQAFFCPLMSIGLLQMSPVSRSFAASTQLDDIHFISSVPRVGGSTSAPLVFSWPPFEEFLCPSAILYPSECPAHLHFCFAMR